MSYLVALANYYVVPFDVSDDAASHNECAADILLLTNKIAVASRRLEIRRCGSVSGRQPPKALYHRGQRNFEDENMVEKMTTTTPTTTLLLLLLLLLHTDDDGDDTQRGFGS